MDYSEAGNGNENRNEKLYDLICKTNSQGLLVLWKIVSYHNFEIEELIIFELYMKEHRIKDLDTLFHLAVTKLMDEGYLDD